jgi:hypothetical protein
MCEDTGFEALIERLMMATGAKTDSALARALDIRPQSVVAAKKRRQIPPGWLVLVAKKFRVSADWLFFGKNVECPQTAASALRRELPEGERHSVPDLEKRLEEQAARIRELERQLTDAKDEAIQAYRLAVEAMRHSADGQGQEAARPKSRADAE